MDVWRYFSRRWLWLAGLAVMVSFVTVDTIVHLRATYGISQQHFFTPPMPTGDSPTGYALGQRDIVLPYVGMDGYHWVMQTQEMLAQGGDPRLRSVDYDNYPFGRELHWSSSFRWWVALLAGIEHFYGAVPLSISVEDVMPFANTLLIVLLIIAMTPTVARRFGAGAAALVALGMMAIGPLYESFCEGKSDHHGLASLSGLLTILFLLGGGAGWIKNTKADAEETENSFLRDWLPDRALAKRWFIASGIAGGIGLWVSTASEAPVLAEVGAGALLATGLLGRSAGQKDFAWPDPSLWRTWGLAGAATSLFFYLLEYFPFHFGLRLEVNHPFYALAWAGGGELLYLLSRWWSGGRLAERASDWLWLFLSALAVASVPVVIVLFADKVFWVADRFLFIFHEDYIAEFKSLARYLDSMYGVPQNRLFLTVVANPLFLLAVPMIAWTWQKLRPTLIGILAASLLIYNGLLLGWCTPAQLNDYFWPAMVVPAIIIVALLALWSPWPEFPLPAKALLLLGLPPGMATLLLSTRQMRWMEIGYALWLAALAGVIIALKLNAGYRWKWPRVVAGVVFLAAVFLPGPGFMIKSWLDSHWKAQMGDVELMEMVTRDASQRLRQRLGNETGVVVSGPTTTTWMIYWGGFKGLGTLYWENLAGLKATMGIYSAQSFDEALKLIQERGVTHIAIYSWDPFYKEYARLAQGRHRPVTPEEAAAEKPLLENAFIYSLFEGRQMAQWLRPVYYPMPGDKALRGHYVMIFEVAPQQTVEESDVRLARWQLAMGNQGAALNSLNAALTANPNYLPALVCGAQLDNMRNRLDEAALLVQKIRGLLGQADSLELEEHIDLAVTFYLNKDPAEAARQISACIKKADLRSLRRTGQDELYNFAKLATLFDLKFRPGLQACILDLLPEPLHVQFLLDAADLQKGSGRLNASLILLRQAAGRQPDAPGPLNALARFLATAHDAALRNGREAVVLALRARQTDPVAHAEIADTLACAYAEAGQFDLAETTEQKAISEADTAKQTDLATQLRVRFDLFRSKAPYHE